MRIISFTRAITAVAVFLPLTSVVSAQGHDHGGHTAIPASNNELEHETRTYAMPKTFKA